MVRQCRFLSRKRFRHKAHRWMEFPVHLNQAELSSNHLEMLLPKQNNMKKNAVIMGMPVTISITDLNAKVNDINEIFSYFKKIDKKFSTYKRNSEIEKINRGEIKKNKYSLEMKKILKLCKQTKKETNGYFDIKINGKLDPSGIVKGYAIHKAAGMLAQRGYKNFYVEIGGDIEVKGKNENQEKWRVGIENPFNRAEIVKVMHLSDRGIATSGTYIRGNHIHNPVLNKEADKIASITVIGPNVYEADRFATAAFAMGEKGIEFIESLKGFEGYLITKNKRAIFTSGFEKNL